MEIVSVMRMNKLSIIFLLLDIVQSRHAVEISLKYVDENHLKLNVTEEGEVETYELVKKRASVRTMLAEDDGIISNLEPQVGNS